MKIINMHQAKTHLSRLAKQAAEGEEIIIGKAGQPLVKLVAYTADTSARIPGSWKGKVKIAKDFDELPKDVLESFYSEV